MVERPEEVPAMQRATKPFVSVGATTLPDTQEWRLNLHPLAESSLRKVQTLFQSTSSSARVSQERAEEMRPKTGSAFY